VSRVSRCKFCGAFIQEEDHFCWSCGSALQLPEAPPPGRPGPPPELRPDLQLTLRRAFLAQRRGHPDEAEKLVREALAREPDNVSALAMLSEMLRARGDLVGAVDAVQRATEAAAAGGAAPEGALQRAREERTQIERDVLGDLGELSDGDWNPLTLFTATGLVWYQSGRFYLALAAIGFVGLLLALVSLLRGGALGYLWFGVSLVAAGWCYYDAETRRESGLFWGPFVLCLGPFGLAIYLLVRY
jgi:hypothetical protein